MDNLYQELIAWNYQITRPTRRIIQESVARELLVLYFRDRIVQHLVYEIISNTRDKRFIYDSYSNRKGKWTLKAIQRASRFMRACSDNFTKDTYVMKLDIQSFFVSIDRNVLRNFLYEKIDCCRVQDKEWFQKLLHQIVFYDYIGNCRDCTTEKERKILPINKTMLSVPKNKWLPLWNLTSQIFANIYLDQLDLFIKHELWIKYYIRYADDFIILSTNKSELLKYRNKIKIFLSDKLKLTLHPDKFYLQNIKKGYIFLWVMIYPFHRTIKKWIISRCFKKMNNRQKSFQKKYQSLMSYNWLAKHHDSYGIQKQWECYFLDISLEE